MSEILLIWANSDEFEEGYLFSEVKSKTDYQIVFNKKNLSTQIIPLGGEINKETVKLILDKLDNFRLSLVETAEEKFIKNIINE